MEAAHHNMRHTLSVGRATHSPRNLKKLHALAQTHVPFSKRADAASLSDQLAHQHQHQQQQQQQQQQGLPVRPPSKSIHRKQRSQSFAATESVFGSSPFSLTDLLSGAGIESGTNQDSGRHKHPQQQQQQQHPHDTQSHIYNRSKARNVGLRPLHDCAVHGTLSHALAYTHLEGPQGWDPQQPQPSLSPQLTPRAASVSGALHSSDRAASVSDSRSRRPAAELLPLSEQQQQRRQLRGEQGRAEELASCAAHVNASRGKGSREGKGGRRGTGPSSGLFGRGSLLRKLAKSMQRGVGGNKGGGGSGPSGVGTGGWHREGDARQVQQR
jgi:hypothetical protein